MCYRDVKTYTQFTGTDEHVSYFALVQVWQRMVSDASLAVLLVYWYRITCKFCMKFPLLYVGQMEQDRLSHKWNLMTKSGKV